MNPCAKQVGRWDRLPPIDIPQPAVPSECRAALMAGQIMPDWGSDSLHPFVINSNLFAARSKTAAAIQPVLHD